MNRKHLVALPLLLIALLMAASSAFAQTTPAGTQIRNRASATYHDTNGISYTSLSNEVITIVLPVTVVIDNQLGFKVYPTLIALVILGLPPIIVNTYTGISSVDPDLIEAARGMGLTERRVLSRVEIPVAIPVISGGVRAAATQIVATATLGAIFGGIGLGRFLVEGIAQNDDGMIFGGVTLVALLCIATEGLFTWIQRRLTSPGLAPAAVWMSRLQDVPAAARV